MIPNESMTIPYKYLKARFGSLILLFSLKKTTKKCRKIIGNSIIELVINNFPSASPRIEAPRLIKIIAELKKTVESNFAEGE
ncbi:hypothetical protein GCM10008018_61710 [Paenibacillus marchantiophytorum]|uniref:Uncharacterized protein n=1 Tax=Paenibacillus marchantiophytorum TaxID=1619310 RepID=A0ABQ1FEX8_9BACL|nr:hypothetical protein GCM10008018_61710 [Paenibacillus marchantiophytorum]